MAGSKYDITAITAITAITVVALDGLVVVAP